MNDVSQRTEFDKRQAMSRTEADQREYLLAACDCLADGGLESFRTLHTQWRRGGAIAALHGSELSPSSAVDEDSATRNPVYSSHSVTESDFGSWSEEWHRLESVWVAIQRANKSNAEETLSDLVKSPWPEIKDLAVRSRQVLLAREWIVKEWSFPGRDDLLTAFIDVLVKPLRLTVHERQRLRRAFDVERGTDVVLGPYCERLKNAHPDCWEAVRESIDSLVRSEPRAERLINGRRPLTTGMKIALAAMIISPILRFGLQQLAKEPPPPPRVDPQLLAQRQAEAQQLIHKVMNTPPNQPPPPKLSVSFLPPKVPPELEEEFQAFCRLCDQQNTSPIPRERLAAMQALREMQHQDDFRFQQFAFERGRRLYEAAEAEKKIAARNAPTADELRKLHVLTIWTERDRQAGVTESTAEKELLSFLRTLGPRLTLVMREYRSRLEENPRAFPSLDTLERNFEIPRLDATAKKSELQP